MRKAVFIVLVLCYPFFEGCTRWAPPLHLYDGEQEPIENLAKFATWYQFTEGNTFIKVLEIDWIKVSEVSLSSISEPEYVFLKPGKHMVYITFVRVADTGPMRRASKIIPFKAEAGHSYIPYVEYKDYPVVFMILYKGLSYPGK